MIFKRDNNLLSLYETESSAFDPIHYDYFFKIFLTVKVSQSKYDFKFHGNKYKV